MALDTIASNTGWTSVRDWLMTRNISAVAVCCSRASLTCAWALREGLVLLLQLSKEARPTMNGREAL
jgi:hypothetical protein